MKIYHIGLLLLWFAAAYGALMLSAVPGDFTHDVCGPWGCYPPLQALTAYHVFSLLAMLLPAGIVIAVAPARRLRFIGTLLFALSTLTFLAMVGQQYLTWYRDVPPMWQQYFPQRILYVIATNGDIPVVQVAIVGVLLWAIGRRRSRVRTPSSTPGG